MIAEIEEIGQVAADRSGIFEHGTTSGAHSGVAVVKAVNFQETITDVW